MHILEPRPVYRMYRVHKHCAISAIYKDAMSPTTQRRKVSLRYSDVESVRFQPSYRISGGLAAESGTTYLDGNRRLLQITSNLQCIVANGHRSCTLYITLRSLLPGVWQRLPSVLWLGTDDNDSARTSCKSRRQGRYSLLWLTSSCNVPISRCVIQVQPSGFRHRNTKVDISLVLCTIKISLELFAMHKIRLSRISSLRSTDCTSSDTPLVYSMLNHSSQQCGPACGIQIC